MADQAAKPQTEVGDQAANLQLALIRSLLHDAVNSLSAAMGFVDLADQREPFAASQSFMIGRAKKAMEATNTRLERALHVSRGDQRVTPSIGRVAVADVIEQVIADHYDTAEQRRISITTAVPDGLVIEADRYQLEQILGNMIGNSIKYNHVDGTIRVDVTVNDARVVFSIADSGYGIRADDVPHIFDLSYRGELHDPLGQPMTIYGLGIGLWLVKTWVEQHAGTIRVESAQGEGTTFIVDLPLVQLPLKVNAPDVTGTSGSA